MSLVVWMCSFLQVFSQTFTLKLAVYFFVLFVFFRAQVQNQPDFWYHALLRPLIVSALIAWLFGFQVVFCAHELIFNIKQRNCVIKSTLNAPNNLSTNQNWTKVQQDSLFVPKVEILLNEVTQKSLNLKKSKNFNSHILIKKSKNWKIKENYKLSNLIKNKQVFEMTICC